MDTLPVRPKMFAGAVGILAALCFMGNVFASPMSGLRTFDTRPLKVKVREAVFEESGLSGSPLKAGDTVLPEKGFNGSTLNVSIPTGSAVISQERGFDDEGLFTPGRVTDDLSLKGVTAPKQMALTMLIAGEMTDHSPTKKGFDSSTLTPIAGAIGDVGSFAEQEYKKATYSEEERLRELERVFEANVTETIFPEAGGPALEAIETGPPLEGAAPLIASGAVEGLTPGPGKEAIYHFNLGASYQKRGDTLRAIEEYKKVLTLDAYNAEVHNNLGVIYKEKGDLDKAVEHYLLVTSLNPGMEEAHNNLGVIHYLQDNTRAAELAYKRALEINPNNPASLINLGIIYKRQKMDKKAIDTFEEVLEVDSTNPEAHYNLAIIYEEQGHLEAAIWHYTSFIGNAGDAYPELTGDVAEHVEDLKVVSGDVLKG